MLDDVFWPGLLSITIMYLAVFFVGVWASRGAPEPSGEGDDALVELLLAGRTLPAWVGLLTMTATWVGGGYINGTAEQTFTSGVLWGGQAGLGYALSLVVGGLFYAARMRRMGYTTLIDPLEQRFGRGMAFALTIPAVLAEVLWSAAILVALGSTFGTIIGLDLKLSIVVSAAVAIAYTVFGGLRAVAWTDVFQLFLIVAGLGLAAPYVVGAVGGWGTITGAVSLSVSSPREAWSWSDYTVLLVLGGIPWNVYFQRVLSSPTPEAARRTSLLAGMLCAAMAVPPMVLGLAATQLTGADLGPGGDATLAAMTEQPALVLPYVLRYAVPQWVGVLGLGAVAAAVMSSVDSSMLSAASLLSWNGYRRLLNPSASAAQVARLVRWLIVVLGLFATVVALTYSSVSALWYLCGDLVYCILFPQLTAALFDPKANRSGAIAGLSVSVLLRLAGGDSTLGLPNLLYPDPVDGIEWPFRTVAMLGGVATLRIVSRLTGGFDPPKPAPLSGREARAEGALPT